VSNVLPENVRAAIRESLHAEPTQVQSVGGGMINQTARVQVNGKSYFVKWKSDAPRSFFEIEVRGLNLLRMANVFRVPEIIAYAEGTANAPAYLILEWIEGASPSAQAKFSPNFGRTLAELHRVTGTTFGLDHDNFIGKLPQRNTATAKWADFYRDHRIAPQLEIARELGYLSLKDSAILWQLMLKIDTILASDEPPSLLHGDLWGGNYFVGTDGHLVVFDPAVYYGNREVEIAFTELFGGPPAGFLSAYREAYPLDAGYEYRRPLLQLYPMLVHLNHFGESYKSGVLEICRRYLTS
jgi:fructosamine-3-kinase